MFACLLAYLVEKRKPFLHHHQADHKANSCCLLARLQKSKNV